MTKDQNLIEPTMNRNENVRLHKCDICENILKTNQGLVRHLKCVHSEEEHKCKRLMVCRTDNCNTFEPTEWKASLLAPPCPAGKWKNGLGGKFASCI